MSESQHALLETSNLSSGVGPAPAQTVALWINLVASVGPDELADFEARDVPHVGARAEVVVDGDTQLRSDTPSPPSSRTSP